MDTNKMRDISREQFEDFWRDTHCDGDEELSEKWLKREAGGYLHRDPSQAFKIWQASREAVVVELPDYQFDETDRADGFNTCLRQSIEAVEAFGLACEVTP